MSMKKKVLAVILCLIIVIATSAMTTYAYLTDQTPAEENTFTMGKVEIELYESPVDKTTGKATGDAARPEGNADVMILPGREIAKDPSVVVKAGSEDCYIRVEMIVTWDKDVKNIFVSDDYDELFPLCAGWRFVGLIQDNKLNPDGTYTEKLVFEYEDLVPKSDKDSYLTPVFTKIVLSEDLTQDQINAIAKTKIDLVAYAIQAEGFADAAAAWAGFAAQNPNT